MKPLQGDSVNNNSCSSTSCDSKSELDRQTLKRLLVQGSKINKLLTCKYYIHLRDSHLLDTLIKTRALYDALRSQLLSSTESSTADLNPCQSSREIKKAFVEAKKSSDIFKLVDLVDKGAVIGLKSISECCSCCTCSSKFQLYENIQKGRRNRQAHARGNISSRSSLVLKQETGEAKNIKSDPCTCACYKNKNIKKSREITEKICPEQQIIEQDRLSTASNNHKLMSLNNGKLRKSCHKLKRAKDCPCPYMENIGEGGNKIIRKSKREIALEKKKSTEILKLAQKTLLDSFKTDRQTFKKKEPVASSMVGNIAEECMIQVKKTVTKSKDQVGKRQAPSPELKKSHLISSRKQNQAQKENPNKSMGKISDTSSTSNTIIQKEASFTTGNERQKKQSKAKKRNKKFLQQAASEAESNTDISKKGKESYSLGGSNQVQKSIESKIPPQKDLTEVANIITKHLPISSTPGKDPIKSNTDTIPGIQKSESIDSIKKSDPARFNKTSSNSLNKINKPKLKSKPSVSFRKRLRLLSAPLRYRPHPQIKEEPSLHKEPAPARHKKPSGLSQRNLKSGSHALKRCFCTVKLNETKSKISKNVSNDNLNCKHNQSINSKTLLSCFVVKTLIKASNLNLHDPKYMSGHATKCECYDYVNQNQAMRSNKRTTQKESDDHLEIKYNVTNDKQSVQYDRAQDITNKKKLSIHASISDCICDELEESTYRHNQPNIEFGVKSSSNHHVSNDPKYFHFKDQLGKSNTRLRTKSTVKDASITTEKPRKLQNGAVQTVITITSKQKHEIEISMNQLEKKKPNICNSRFSIELFNKDYNNGLKITQSKVKFVYKCGDRTKQLPNKQSQTNSSTQRSKYTSTKHGLSRCFCTLQLGKLEKKKYNNRKVTMIQPTNKVEGSQSQVKLKIVRHDKMPYKYDFSICSPKRCFSQRLKVELAKKERNLKKSIKTKSRPYFSLTSIHSTLTSPNSEILTLISKRNKRKPSDVTTHQGRSIFSRKLFKSKRSYCLCSPIDKHNKINKDTKIRSSKDLQKRMLLRNKKLQQSSLFGLTRKRCLCTFKLSKKGTKLTESEYSDQLRPYESKCLEPFLLENNKSNTLKHFGCVTDKTKMKSKSSDTRPLRSTSKLLFVKSDLQQRNTSLQKVMKMRKYSDLSHLPQRGREMYMDNFLKQRVKIGSNFSFNIEFYKGITPENNYNHNRTKNINVNFLHNKQEYNRLTKRYSSHQNTHLDTKRLSPTPNRCLYTLKLSKMDEQRRDNKLLLPFGTKQLTQVYAVSTVAIAENKIKTPEILEVDHDFPCIDSYYPTYSNNTSSHTKQWQYFNKSPKSSLSISMEALKTKNVQSYIRESKYRLLQISSIDQSLLDFASNESVRFETAFSCEIDYLKNICSKKRQTLRTAQSQNDTLELRQRTSKNPETERAQNITHLSQLTGVQPLLRRCYCTMNIQVARQPRKLLDYECEPGICIPGDCDPYECQKLIMKRLKRQVSRMSGTESRSRSSSCETTSTGSCAKNVQSGFGEPKHRSRGYGPRSRPRPRRVRPQGLKYQTLPRTAREPAPAHRQAVRVGSSFSFDIEFSKGSSKSAPTTDFVKVPKRQMMSSSSTTYHRHGMDRGTKYGGRRYHRGTESMMKQMRHRASSVTPMLKRCFCTLKLQKKGRLQKEWELRGTDHGTSTPPQFSVEKPILRRTERGQNTMRYRRSLELLHTKDFGTDSMASSKSSSSMTSSHKQKRKRIQSRKIRAKKVRSRDTLVRSKPSVMSIDRPVQDRPSKPSRQAVKISSNFSFNIEFYKDKTGSGNDNTRPSEVYVQKTPKEFRKVPKQVYAHRSMRESSSQYRKGTRDDDSQIGIYQRGRSTMTSSFLKRCFCTAKLQGINVDAVQGTNVDAVQGINVDAATSARQHRSLSKLKRCLCKLTSASKRLRRGSNVGHERATPISDKRVRMTQTRGRSPALLPYECEPGVCNPDFCDPHECIKLIRKRLRKEKMTGTAGPRTISTSSNFTSSQSSRATMIQSRSARPKVKTTQARPARRRERRRRQDYAPRERVLQEPVVSPVSPQRQAVRIGSNFSFNIEFYKDKGCNNLDVQAAAPLVKRPRPIRMRDRGHGAYRRMRTRDRGLRGRRWPARSRDSQMDSTKSRDIGLGPMLRRCFCTLKLQKRARVKGKSKALTKAEAKTVPKETKGKKKDKCLCTPPVKEVATLHTRSVMTVKNQRRRKAFPYKLEPYECEPGICVPGECDPYECLKRINKRLMYSSGTSTDRLGRISTSVMTDYGRGYRHSETQSFMQRKKPMRTRYTRTRDRERRPQRVKRAYRERRPESRSTEYRSTVVEETTKQAVKLGSNFNFDIEFFKDKSFGGPVVTSRPIKRDVAYDKPRRTSSRSTEWRSTCCRNKKLQLSRANRHMDSQALSPSMRSTMTGTVAPFLKRCFCTLQLHCTTENQRTPFDCFSDVSKRNKVKSQTKRETSNVERKYYSRKQAQFPGRKLRQTFSCECEPGECDPYECIKRRMQSKQAGTESYKYRSISSSTDGEIKYVPGRIKARSYPSRRNVKTSWRSGKTSRDQFQVDTSPKRQAVRIGSNFSFEIEFFKDKSLQVPSVREVNQIVKKEEKNKVNRRGAKRKARSVPRSNITKRGTVARSKTNKSMSSCGCHRDVQSQSQLKKTDKGIGTPLLKRCVCTLKLEKKGKQRYITPKKIESSKRECTHTKSKTKAEIEPVARVIGTKTKNCRCNAQNDNIPKAKNCKCNTKNKNCKCNAMNTPLKQDQNVIPVKKDKCVCDNGPKAKKCKCNTVKTCVCYKMSKKKNCKCNESCTCETVQTSDKKTSKKGKYDPLQNFEPVKCVCGSLKKRTRRMSGTPETRSIQSSRVSSIAAQFIPAYKHKTIKYKGKPYSPENINSIVEEPRYPILHGKDARQDVKISSNFTFGIELLKEMLPPVADNVKGVDIRDTKIGDYGDKKDSYSTKLQSRSDRTESTSSPVVMLKKCFCTSKLQKPIHRQSLGMYRVEEIRPMSCFQPRDYWVQYQTQQTTKYFKMNPEELETIVSYAPSRYDKINNNKDYHSCRKTNFNRVDPTKKGAITKHSETKQSTFKKMLYYCKNLFTKRSNKQNIKNMEFKTKATNKPPLIDTLKPSKSDRHPNKAAIADIKKSKSLKAAKVSGKDDYKKKYSRFQSGDHQGTKLQNTGLKLKKNCQHCQIKFKHAIPIQDNVRFTTLRTNKALRCKPKDAIVTEQEKDTKPVSFLFKSLKFINSEDIKNLKLCSCCGGIKRIRNLPSANNFLDIKNKLLEYSEDAITTAISKDLIAIPTKNNIPEEKTELTQENQKKNKQSCPRCACKSVSKPNTKQGKKYSFGVCGSAVCKREAERRAENTHHAECIECKRQCGTLICPAESEKEALASVSVCHRAPNQKKKKENLEQAKTRGKFHKAEDKKVVIENRKEKSKKLTKYKNTPDSLLVAESVLKSTGDILSNLHRPVSDPKGTYRKCQSYLRDSMRAWNKIQKPANNGPGVETLQLLKLRCQATKCVKAGEDILEDYPVTNFGKHSNNADRKKGFHPKKAFLAASSGLWLWMESIHAFAKKEAVA